MAKRRPQHILIVTGGRDFTGDDAEYIVNVVLTGYRFWHGVDLHLFYGCAKGADTLCKDAAERLNGILLHPFPVDWEKAKVELGAGWKKAGHIRNKKMIDAALKRFKPKKGDTINCFAFKDDIYEKSGTRNAARYADKKGIPTFVVGRFARN